METDKRKVGIGNKETIALGAARVKIVDITIEQVKVKNEKESEKVSCLAKHPAREEAISISSVKYEKKGQLSVDGLWLNLDEEGLIRKGSALAVFLQYLKAKNIEELKDKEVDAVLDPKGYLCFKAY